jgi:hypothetical protein
MCTTSADCRTVIANMLTVMSGMDPHTIRVTCIGMVGVLGVGQSCLLGQATTVGSVVCSMSCLKEKSFLALVIVAWYRMQPPLSTSQNHSQPLLD